MGASAYTFIEHRTPGAEQWEGSGVSVRRDYEIFDLLAGGRSGTGFLHPPRGLPPDISDAVLREACFRLTDGEEEGRRTTKRSAMTMPPFGRVIRRGDADYFYDSSYLHSHTWLTLPEIEASLAHGKRADSLDETYVVLMTQMRQLAGSGKETRMIIWFDAGPVSSAAGQVIKRIHEVLLVDWAPLDIRWHKPRGLKFWLPPTYFIPDLEESDKYYERVGPIYQILAGSRSEQQLVDFLKKAEQELGSVVSSPEQLQKVAGKLLALDVAL